MRFIFRGNRRPYGIPPPRPLLLFSSAMPCFLGTPSRCPPPPCPFPSARRSSLAPSRPSDYLLPSPASFPAPAFSRTSVLFGLLSPVSTLLMTDYSLLHLPCPGIPFLGIRPPPPAPVPSRPFLSLLVPPLYSLFPAPAVPVVFLGGRRFWHENAKYFFIWEIIVNFLLLLAFNVK